MCFVFDTLCQEVRTAISKPSRLQEKLESNSTLKVVYNGAALVNVLHWQLGIETSGIEEVKVRASRQLPPT